MVTKPLRLGNSPAHVHRLFGFGNANGVIRRSWYGVTILSRDAYSFLTERGNVSFSNTDNTVPTIIIVTHNSIWNGHKKLFLLGMRMHTDSHTHGILQRQVSSDSHNFCCCVFPMRISKLVSHHCQPTALVYRR